VSAGIWAVVSMELAKAERAALTAVSTAFDDARQRLQIAAIESDSGVLPTAGGTPDDDTNGND
jgi:hypothetical protein